MRSYPVPHKGNHAKIVALTELLPLWQRGLVHVQLIQIRNMKQGKRLGYIDTKGLPDYLSQRQWKSVTNQVNAGLRSWQSTAVIKMRPLIREATDDPEELKRLYTLSKSLKWWEDTTLTKLIAKLARTTHPFPNFSRVRTMLMDGTIAQVENSKTETFSRWVRFSTPAGVVRIPLRKSSYMEGKEGTVRNFCQVQVKEDDQIVVRLVKESSVTPVREIGDVMGLDWGLKNLLTTSTGQQYGQQLYAWLVERDEEVMGLVKRLQAQGIKPSSSKRYRKLNHRIREYVKNEVGRILNLISAQEVRELVVESLDFRGGGLSKRLNRIVTRAGRSALRQKLASLGEDKGVVVTEVNPRYSSQECSGCGFVWKGNRKSQSGFMCGFCGKVLYADINAARCILERRSSPIAGQFVSSGAVLAYLDREFNALWGVVPDLVRER